MITRLLRARSIHIIPLIVLAAAAAFAGCGDDGTGTRVNQPPTAELTSGPVEGGTTFYRIRVFWTGSDPDGVISYYQYAVDPPSAFTEEEIADPAGSTGVQTRILPGSEEGLDTLRVSKVVDGETYTFDWVSTLAFNRVFRFSATKADSAFDGGTFEPTGRFTGMNSIYVRSVDNDGAASPPDHVAFTAETVAPSATITKPLIGADLLTFGPHITLSWTGTDPDGGGAKPVGYLYRLLDLRSLDPPVAIWRAPVEDLLGDEGIDSVWTYVSADTLEHTFFPKVPGAYILGVRAVDEAGAVEPFLDYGRNAFKFQTLTSAGKPLVTLFEPSLGEFNYRGYASPYVVEVPAGISYSIQVTCSAIDYGSLCESFRWGLNLADPMGDEGWTPLDASHRIPPLVFDDAGTVQTLYVEVTDDQGGKTVAALVFNVIAAPFDREVLLVDDTRDGTYPIDSQHDAFWSGLFEDSGRLDPASDVDLYDIYGAGDTYTPSPIPPTLSDLLHYRLVIWECGGAGYNGNSGLRQVTSKGNTLPLYLHAGGRAWIGGTMTIAAMLPAPGLGADFVYPKEMEPGTFVWDFLKLYSGNIDNAKGFPVDDNMIAVEPFPGRPAVYPAMEQDPLKVNQVIMSIRDCDAIFDPILARDLDGFTGQLDSLYVYKAVKANSSFNNKLNALRWHDPDPGRNQGRVQWFGFPLYYMKKDQAQETFNRSLDWFREESGP